jgi:hypothetical protein
MTSDQHTSSLESESVFEAFSAPRGHCDSLIRPKLGDASGLIQSNRSTAESYPTELASFREDARAELLRDAKRYTSAYRDLDGWTAPAASIVMAGHQPSLFHPGVWFKNFALDRVASMSGSIAVNLVVDSDVAPPSSIRVPHVDPSSGSLGFTAVPYDRRGGGVPYEQALVEDRELFDRFDRNVIDAVSGVVDDPLVGSLWQHAREAINRCGYAGCALAQARHRFEADQGLRTLEIPQSVVCRGEAFAAFAMQILRDLPRFHQCYNDSAGLYRRSHGIRSKAHPVPNLGRDEDWFEAPFWVYGNQSPKRRSVWIRMTSAGSVMEISDRDKRHRKIDSANKASAVESFLALSSPEFKIRSRAIVTTMYARTVLSDLFLHGIGGGKYDQLGDLISRTFWGIQPPKFMVLSATVLLPGHEQMSVAEIDGRLEELSRKRRDIEYQPERFDRSGYIPADLIEKKRSLLSSIPSTPDKGDWHREITELNREMSSRLESVRAEMDTNQSTLDARRREATIWNSREHAFCVYPLAYLKEAYERMMASQI